MIDIRKSIAVDAIALVVYLIVSLPSLTGVAFHEWLGVGLFAVLVFHCAQHFDWIVDTLKGFAKAKSLARRARFVLDAMIAVALTVVMVSGLLISGAVLPACGFFANGYYLWDPLHAASAKVLLALILVHLAVNFGVVARFIGRGAPSGSTRGFEEDDGGMLRNGGERDDG